MKTYTEIAQHIDRQLETIESGLDLSDMTIAHGLHSFRFGTSGFLEELFQRAGLEDGHVFYDLGSGYGHVLFYGALQFPGVRFRGIEILGERNAVCQNVIRESGLANVTAEQGDILEADLSDGDVFYLFNPLFGFQYEQLLETLRKIAAVRPIVVVAESRCDVFDQCEWLTLRHTTDIDILRKINYYHSQPANGISETI